MGGVVKAVKSVAKGVGGVLGFGAGADAADAAQDAANTQAAYQREALDYLKQTEKLPQQFREGALTNLAGLYGLEGGEGSQEDLIQRAIQSPLYQKLIGGRQAGEDAILRNYAATGGLRSGNVNDSLFTYDTQLQNDALLQSYNNQLQGLQGLAQLPSNANAIAQQTSGIGTTLGQGQVAAAQAKQTGNQNLFNNLLGLGSAAVGIFSDRRLKKDIELIGENNGYKWYRWKWNSIAEKMGLKGSCQGCMADEIVDRHPAAVTLRHGFMFIEYGKIAEEVSYAAV